MAKRTVLRALLGLLLTGLAVALVGTWLNHERFTANRSCDNFFEIDEGTSSVVHRDGHSVTCRYRYDGDGHEVVETYAYSWAWPASLTAANLLVLAGLGVFRLQERTNRQDRTAATTSA